VTCEAAPGRRLERLHGAVERGDRFAETIGGWVLRLDPVEYGWGLQISTMDRPAEDLSRLTPPWHFVPNAREIEVGIFGTRTIRVRTMAA
jgi:hypothetical protein